jgi:hypothetical protein
MGGAQLVHTVEDRLGIRHVPEREILFDGVRIDFRRDRSRRENRFELRGKQQLRVGSHNVIKRLDPEPIASEKECLPVPVPDRKRKHAVEPADALLAPLFPRVDDDLGIAASAERVPERDQLLHQLVKIVDLTVVGDDDGFVFVVKRLMAAREIDDRQPPMAESDAGLDVIALTVGTTMELSRVHAFQHAPVDFSPFR